MRAEQEHRKAEDHTGAGHGLGGCRDGAVLAPIAQHRTEAWMIEQPLLKARRDRAKPQAARIRNMVVGISGSTAPISASSSISQAKQRYGMRVIRPSAGSTTTEILACHARGLLYSKSRH